MQSITTPVSAASLNPPSVKPRTSSLTIAVTERRDSLVAISTPDELAGPSQSATLTAASESTSRPQVRRRADSNLSDRSSTSVTSLSSIEVGKGISYSRSSTIRRRAPALGPSRVAQDTNKTLGTIAGSGQTAEAAAGDKEMLVPEPVDFLTSQLRGVDGDDDNSALAGLRPASRPYQYFLNQPTKGDDSHGSMIEFLQSSSSGSSEDVTLSFAPVRLEEPVVASSTVAVGDQRGVSEVVGDAAELAPAVEQETKADPRRVGAAGSLYVEDIDVDVSTSDLRTFLAIPPTLASNAPTPSDTQPARRRSFLLRRRERSRRLPTTVVEDADEDVPALTRDARASSVSSSASSSIALETDVSPTTFHGPGPNGSLTKRSGGGGTSDSDHSEIVCAQQAREVLHRSGGLLAPRPQMGSRSSTSPDVLPTRATLHKVHPVAALQQGGHVDRRASIAIVVNDHSASERRDRQQRPKSALLQLHTKTLPALDTHSGNIRDVSPTSPVANGRRSKRRPLSGLFRRTSSSSRHSSAIISPRSELTEDEAIDGGGGGGGGGGAWRGPDPRKRSTSGVSGWQRFVKRVVGGGSGGGGVTSPEVEHHSSFDEKDRRSSMSSSTSGASLRWRSSATTTAAVSGDEQQQSTQKHPTAAGGHEDGSLALDDGATDCALSRNNTVKPLRHRAGTQSTRSQPSVESFEAGEYPKEDLIGREQVVGVGAGAGHGMTLIAGRI